MFPIVVVATLLLGQSETDADIIDRPVADVDVSFVNGLVRALVRRHDALTAVSLLNMSVPRSLEGEPEGEYCRRAISIRSDGMFRSDNSHGHDRLPWNLSLRRKTLVVTTLESTVLENLNRCVSDIAFTDAGAAPDPIQNENIFEVLCWWPFANWSCPQLYGHAYSMPALLNEGTYRLLPEKETIGSKPCYTLIVNDILTVWCDCDHPECVLKSERYDPKTRAVNARFEMTDYGDFGENIWLPKQFRIVRFDTYAHKPELRENVIYDNTFLVSDIKVNEDVDVSFFRQEYAPGTVRVIRSSEETRYEPVVDGQLDHFKSMLEWCRFGSPQKTAKQDSRWGNRLLIFVLFFLVGCGIVFAISRARSFR